MTSTPRYPARPPQYRAVARLERDLGCPGATDHALSYRAALDHDTRESCPSEACDLLDRWGLQAYYVPVRWGGRLGSYEEPIGLVRAVARRDLTVAVSHARTVLGSTAVWLGGSASQKQELGRAILRGERFALALTEAPHGSHLLGNEVVAEEHGDALVLDGTKVMINGLRRGRGMVVFARTDPEGGPRGFSLLLLDRGRLAPDTHQLLPRIRTHGLRGGDIAGIRFAGCRVPATARIGAPGSGLEIVVQLLQVTRILAAGLALGTGEAALGTAIRCWPGRARRRDESWIAACLATSFLDLLVGDCVVTVAARAVTVSSEQLSVHSAVSKYRVPTAVEEMFGRLADILGEAAWRWDGGAEAGLFDKLRRDNAVISLFDGSSVVNLSVLAQQLVQLCRGTPEEPPPELLRGLAHLAEPAPELAAERLTLFNRGRDAVLDGLAAAARSLRAVPVSGRAARAVREAAVERTEVVLARVRGLGHDVARLRQRQRRGGAAPEMFRLAGEYSTAHAAACCLHIWLHNRDGMDDFFARGEWLVLALDRLTQRWCEPAERPAVWRRRVLDELRDRHETGRTLGLVPLETL